MKNLVTGIHGQLGHDVMLEGQRRGYDMVGFDIDTMDITDDEAVNRIFSAEAPDAVIHCAAYTAVDLAEKEREKCCAVNVDGTENVARASARCGAKLIYVSTDYVYDGRGEEPHPVSEKKVPVNYYGLTKSQGEDRVTALCDRYFIVRTSWVFGQNGRNFVKTMLRLGKEKEQISVVSDQIGSPTYTPDLARLLLDMAETEEYGIYHGTNSGFCSWYEFASAIMKKAGLSCEVKPILTKDYASAAVRPLNSRLDSGCLVEKGFRLLPPWEDALARFLEESLN